MHNIEAVLLLMQDNDIVLCDGACNRGYHEQCLQPRIHAQELPEDEGWLCPACDAKVCPLPLLWLPTDAHLLPVVTQIWVSDSGLMSPSALDSCYHHCCVASCPALCTSCGFSWIGTCRPLQFVAKIWGPDSVK